MILKYNRKKVLEIIKTLEARPQNYIELLNKISSPASLTTLDGIYHAVNTRFIETLDYSSEEVIGISSSDLNLWLSMEDKFKLVASIKDKGYLEGLNSNFITKSGKILNAFISSGIAKLNGEAFVFTIVEEVEEVKKSETVLKKVLNKERELANIVRQAPMAIIIGDMNGKVHNFNKKTCHLLGYSESELANINWRELTPSKWHDLENEKFKELEESSSIITYEKECVKKDGSLIPLELSISGILDKNDKLIKFIAFAKDISEKKEMENILNKSQLLKAVGEMASSVAHDFNNSLQVIIGNIELLLELDELSPKVKEYIDTIILSVNDATERVKLLQRLGDKKQANTEFSFILVEDLLNEVIIQTRPLWKDKKQKLGLKVNIKKSFEHGLRVLGNLGELRTVFYNIIKNSIEALDEGGDIIISSEKLETEVVIKVSDTGIGMTQETMSNIFQPFYSTKDFGLGRGLGMSGAHSIIEEHKGNISLESRLGIGTSFVVSLPYKEFEFQDEEDELVEKYLKKLRILWVDDEVMLQKLGKKILNKLGHKTDLASDGVDALEILNKNKSYDLLITDIGMPNMNGWQLIEEVRKKFDKNIRIIVLTGWGGEISRDERSNYNIDGILEKPVRVEELKNCISKVMNKKL